MIEKGHSSYGIEGRTWHGVAATLWVVLLVGWLLAEIGTALSRQELTATTDLVVWVALVVVQMMIWGSVLYINLQILSGLPSSDSVWSALRFVIVVLIIVVSPLVIGAALLLGSAETSNQSLDLVGGTRSAREAAILTLAGVISAIPAFLVLHSVHSNCVRGSWEVDSHVTRRIMYLRRITRIAVMSLGVTIAMFIVTTSVARDGIAERSDVFAVESQHLLLVGGVFTAALFAMFVYAKSATDGRAERMVDEVLPEVTLTSGDEFLTRQQARKEMGNALGLGVGAQESFQNLVVVASPLLGSIVTMFISGRV